MYKIKCRVMKERMRLSEFFKDYDKLRTGRILKTVFPRAMDLASLKLTKVEVEQLMNRCAWSQMRKCRKTEAALFVALSGPAHTTPKEFDNAALFLRLIYRSHQSVTKTELFENSLRTGGIWKRRQFWNHVIPIHEFSWSTNLKWPVIVTFSNFSDIDWTGS